MYDVAIIGTGPAGISAAITAKLRNKTVLLIGSASLSDKISKAHLIQNYPGFPDISGSELAAGLSEHINKMNIEINDERVTAVYSMGRYFAIQTDVGLYEAATVILATGVLHGKPLPGETEFLGRGVSYCATCDAALYRDKVVAVVGYSAEYEHEAYFLTEIAAKVYYLPMYNANIETAGRLDVIKSPVTGILGDIKVRQLTTGDNTYDVDGVFVLRDSIAPSQLVPGIKTENNHIIVNMQMETNIPGCFACGDVVGRPYQYIKSAGQGNVAALSAVSYIDTNK